MMSELKFNTSANKRIAMNSIFMSIRMVLVLFLTFYTTRIVLSILGVEDYGVYNVVAGFVSMFSFLSTSMSNGIQRFFNYELGKNDIERAKSVFNTAIKIQVITAIIIVLITESIGVWYLQNKMVIPQSRLFAANWIFQFSIISFVFTIMQAPFVASIIAHEKLNYYAIISVMDAILKLGIALILPSIEHNKLIMYGLLFAIISVINIVMYAGYARIHFQEIRFCKEFNKKLFHSMLGFSGWNFFGSFAGVMKEQGMNLVLNLFFGPVVNAARGLATQVNSGLQSFVQNISVPIRPQVIQSYASRNYKRCINLTFTLSKLSCCIIYLLSLPIILEIDYILHLWLGDNIPSHTAAFVVIVIFISYVNNLNSAVSGIVHASGQMKKYQVVTSIISLMCIPSSALLLKFGCSPEIALLMIFVFSTISQYVSLRILQKIIKFSLLDYWRKILYPFFCLVVYSSFLPMIPRFFMEESFVRFLVVGLISVVSVSGGIYFVVLNNSERNLISQIFKKTAKKAK